MKRAGRYTILDHEQAPAYEVVGKAFSWGNDLSFRRAGDGVEVARICQKLLSWKPTYELQRSGALFATVVKEFSWWEKTFTVDVPGPNDYVVKGSFWSHEFVFERSGQLVATASKKRWEWSDQYGIDIVPGEDDVTILATAVVIDLVCHDQEAAAV